MPANTTELEKRLWGAADELRANSKLKSSEYSVPVLGLIFLRYADHKFAKKSQIKTKELNGLDFVLFERDTPTRKATDRILKAYGVEVKKIAEFDNIETIKRAVQVGFGLAILPLPSVSEEERTGHLAVIKLAEKEWVRPVGVIYRSDRNLSLAAKKFVQLLENPAAT